MELNVLFGYQSLSESEHLDNLESVIASASDRVWVIEADRELVGWMHALLALRLSSPAFIEIVGLVVSPAYQRHGLGRQLVESAEQWADELGLKTRVRCNESRKDANEFYRALGFNMLKRQNVFEKDYRGNQDDA